MNDTLNMNRLWLLIKRQWKENNKGYLLIWGALSLFILGLSALTFSSEQDVEMILYVLLFCFGGCAMTTSLFSRWSDFGRSSFFILLPASSAEKFLCGLFYGFILYIPAYLLNFVIVRYFLTPLLLLPFPGNSLSFSSFIDKGIRDFNFYPFHFYVFTALSLFYIQSVYMIIMIQFRKRQILIFVMILLAVLLVHNFGMRMLMMHLTNFSEGGLLTPGIFIFYDPGFGYYATHANTPVSEYFAFIKLIRHLNSLTWFVVFFMLYLTAWSKLKEREL